MTKRRYIRLNIESIESDIASRYALRRKSEGDALRSYFKDVVDHDRLDAKIKESVEFAAESGW